MLKKIVTSKKIELMKSQLAELQSKYQKMGRGLSEAASHGGATVSKIPEYAAIEESLNVLERRIENLVKEISIAHVIQPEDFSNFDIVSAISAVRTLDVLTGVIEVYCFGDAVVVPKDFKGTIITQQSPIGSTLISRTIGETVEISLPANKRLLKIIDIGKIKED